jgi:hypothetical protein
MLVVIRQPYRQLLRIQDALYKAIQKEDTPPMALAQLARAYTDVEQEKRTMRAKPKGSGNGSANTRKHRQLAGPVEASPQELAAATTPPDPVPDTEPGHPGR